MNPDRWEKRHKLSLKVKQAGLDQDRDHLRNLGEFRQGTSPRDADSDDDGLRDGKEHGVGNDPADKDSDGDGVKDGDENAGTIASFDGTTLTSTSPPGARSRAWSPSERKSSAGSRMTTRIPSRHASAPAPATRAMTTMATTASMAVATAMAATVTRRTCTVEDLVEGTIVHEAEIRISAPLGRLFT